MRGKRCEEVKPGFYVPDVKIRVDVFNPEEQPDVEVDGNTIVVYTTPERPEDKFWSGRGGVRLAPYGQLVVNTQPNRLSPGNYIISIKYRTENMTLAPGRKWPLWVRLDKQPPRPGSVCAGRPERNDFQIEAKETKIGG